MRGFLTSGPDFFPGWVSIVFSVGLALGIVHHLPCLISGHRNRWFHAGHTAMALSMIYMFLSMSYYWTWLPPAWQMAFFISSSTAIVVYVLTRFVRGRSMNFLWILLLVQQAAMAYMWYPMTDWNAVLVFVLVAWFAIEAFGWAANLLPDDVRRLENRPWFPHEVAVKNAAARRVSLRQSATSGSWSSPSPGTQVRSETDCHASAHLVVSDWRDRASMAIMAMSMGYMFYGMQLLALTMPPTQ